MFGLHSQVYSRPFFTSVPPGAKEPITMARKTEPKRCAHHLWIWYRGRYISLRQLSSSATSQKSSKGNPSSSMAAHSAPLPVAPAATWHPSSFVLFNAAFPVPRGAYLLPFIVIIQNAGSRFNGRRLGDPPRKHHREFLRGGTRSPSDIPQPTDTPPCTPSYQLVETAQPHTLDNLSSV